MKIVVTGANKVVAQLRGMSLSGNSYLDLRVGYRAPYARKQHEDMSLNHPHGGQAKFLEQPAREHRMQMKSIVREYLSRRRRSLEDGLKAAGKFLLEESKKLVPVDTGYLRESGYIEVV